MNSEFWSAFSAAFTAFGSIATVVTLIYLARQLHSSARQATVDFLLRLEDNFSTRHHLTYYRLGAHGDLSPTAVVSLEGPEALATVSALELYLDFFATLNVLLEHGVVSLQTLDRMFAHRFFTVALSPHAQTLLRAQPDYWKDFTDLHTRWLKHRRSHALPIPELALPQSDESSNPRIRNA